MNTILVVVLIMEIKTAMYSVEFTNEWDCKAAGGALETAVNALVDEAKYKLVWTCRNR